MVNLGAGKNSRMRMQYRSDTCVHARVRVGDRSFSPFIHCWYVVCWCSILVLAGLWQTRIKFDGSVTCFQRLCNASEGPPVPLVPRPVLLAAVPPAQARLVLLG